MKNTPKITLNSGEQSVKIHLSTPINPLLTNDYFIKYRLVGKTEWSALTTTDLIELPLLAPATYTLEIVGVKNGLEGTPQYLTFRIPKIWYKNE